MICGLGNAARQYESNAYRSQARWHIPLLEVTLGVGEWGIAEDVCSVSDEVLSKLRVDVIRPSREPLCCPEAINKNEI